MIAVDVFVFALAWWLGLYLLARDLRKPLLRRAGLGLLCYALALAAATLARAASEPRLAAALAQLHWWLVFLPALCWAGALLALLPEAWPPRAALDRAWRSALVPQLAAIIWLAPRAGLAGGGPPALSRPLPYLALMLLVLLPLAGALGLVLRQRAAMRTRNPLGLLLGAGLFFGLGVGLLLFPLPWLPHTAKLLIVELDLIGLGLAIAIFDALDEGQGLRRDLLRSLVAAAAAALLFGGQVGLALALGGGATLPLQALLLAVVAAAIALAALADPLASLLDRLVFAGAPQLQRERAELRGAASALPRAPNGLLLDQIDEAEFVRLTRRALSHYGDLPRLAGSPLTQLPVIAERLAARRAPDDALERATELKALLAECVLRLKPRAAGEFGTSDEWRYYNALFFPYIAGLRPYSRRNATQPPGPAERQALEWFQAQVPERTLHNWQNGGARLIAQDLRDRRLDVP